MLLPICFYLSDVDTILTKDVVSCDRCYVTVVMAFIMAECCATVVDETSLI